MRMHVVDDFTIRPSTGDAARSELLARGRNVGFIDGRRIEAQVAVDQEGYLVIATYDVPYEESVVLCLFDSQFRLLDRKRLGRALQPGIVSDVRLTSEGLEFCFPQNEQWLVQIEAAKWSRLLGRRHLRLILRRKASC